MFPLRLPMNVRFLCLIPFLFALGACEPDKPPAKPAKPEPAAVPAPAPTPVLPSPPAVEPAKPAAPEKATVKSPELKPKPAVAVKPTPPAPAKVEEAPKANLDLSLPPELVEQVEPLEDKPLDSVLPSFFVDKAPTESPFQLNGRLITNDREDDYWQSVEGAELQFEFKR
ncbi:hypothetical protein [Pseudomonas indica]|uniref:hypothetical protein n=1 Tax=Pseudomonas indica TaxID=137658 RepID=UPI001FCDD776|nr:hypothetical protein [Pseudomonas indica]